MYSLSWMLHGNRCSALQGDGKGGSGVVNLDLELLKPCKVLAVSVGSNVQERIERAAPADRVWLEYAYRKRHPILQYLPTKQWWREHARRIGVP